MKIIKNDLKAFQKWLDQRNYELPAIDLIVKEIVQAVKDRGDEALYDFTEKFDGLKLKHALVSQTEREKGVEKIQPKLKQALDKAYERITEYHSLQVQERKFIKKENYYLEERITAIESVGMYVPGGKAAYPSTVLMNGIPAKLAGVKKLIMVTPPNASFPLKPSLLYAAKLVGVDEIYTLGGAQSIAALAYGTETIPKVDKIVGPGNIYVSMAKKLVSDHVGIDMIAGPSEILILADDYSKVDFIAADMIAQAEHDERASAMVITTSKEIIDPLIEALNKQIENHPRQDIINKSLMDCGLICYVDSLEKAYDCCNKIAPEHLEVLTQNPQENLKYLKNAGAIFLGHFTPEALGDYMAGPNHTLPTQGTAKFSSPLSVDDFIKKTSILSFNLKGFEAISESVMCIAEDEGLIGHKLAVAIRRKTYESL